MFDTSICFLLSGSCGQQRSSILPSPCPPLPAHAGQVISPGVLGLPPGTTCETPRLGGVQEGSRSSGSSTQPFTNDRVQTPVRGSFQSSWSSVRVGTQIGGYMSSSPLTLTHKTLTYLHSWPRGHRLMKPGEPHHLQKAENILSQQTVLVLLSLLMATAATLNSGSLLFFFSVDRSHVRPRLSELTSNMRKSM